MMLQVPLPKLHKFERESDCMYFWSACGVSLYDDEVLGMFILPCRHAYHLYCFAHIAAKEDTCLVSGCNQLISKNFKSFVFIDNGHKSFGCIKTGKKFYFMSCDSYVEHN